MTKWRRLRWNDEDRVHMEEPPKIHVHVLAAIALICVFMIAVLQIAGKLPW